MSVHPNDEDDRHVPRSRLPAHPAAIGHPQHLHPGNTWLCAPAGAVNAVISASAGNVVIVAGAGTGVGAGAGAVASTGTGCEY